MIRLLRQPVVILILLTQVMFGSTAGSLICLGGCDPAPTAFDHACPHHETSDWPVPTPAQPHEGDDDCDCIDVSLPIARSDASRIADDLVGAVAVPAALEVCLHAPPVAPSARHALTTRGAPTPLGIRTTRLLI